MKKSLIAIVVLSTLLIGLYGMRQALLTSYAEWFNVSNAQCPSDLILIMAGNPAVRVHHALSLYDQGCAPRIAFTSTRHAGHYRSIFLSSSDKVKTVLELKGVQGVIELPSLKGGATSTFDEAYDLFHYLKQFPEIKRVLLVTDRYHTRRTLYAFEKIRKKLKSHTVLSISGASNRIYDESNWWHTEAGISHFFLEPLKLLVYAFRDHNVQGIEEY